MKCPHCGMNIRDEVTECGYCGGKITRHPKRIETGPVRFTDSTGAASQKAGQHSQGPEGEPGSEDEEEEGGLSAILQQGEQVLIGALNVSVKKFFFHAYLTNKRIFLIDTQEKKLKVTAKDVARDTIAGSIVEFSESSDPVLVLSIKSGDDDIKTMKLVFAQNGTDRSQEIDEWITLLSGEEPKKSARKPAQASRKPAPEPEPEPEYEPEEEPAPAPVMPEKPRHQQELRPVRKPHKDHERQPPVKRLLTTYTVPEEEVPEPEEEAPLPPRKAPVRHIVKTGYDREIPPTEESERIPVRKPEVQSAMKVAMKGAIRQTAHQPLQTVKKTVIETPDSRPAAEYEPGAQHVPQRRPIVQEKIAETPVREEVVEAADNSPQFCHNCGKKLPHSANFCPGCGTKLNMNRTNPHARTNPKKATRTDPPGQEHRPVVDHRDEDEVEAERSVTPARPPVRKAPKGSEMTILHKFLRR